MTKHTDPDTAATITRSRWRRTTETAVLRVEETVGDMYLSNLRDLVRLTEHLPGTALVRADGNGIDITYEVREADEDPDRTPTAPDSAVDPEPGGC